MPPPPPAHHPTACALACSEAPAPPPPHHSPPASLPCRTALALIEGVPIDSATTSVCILSLLDDDTRYSERAQRRESTTGSRDDKFVEKLLEKLERHAGFVKASGRAWDPAHAQWAAARGFDRKLFGGAHFAIRHFGSTVPCARAAALTSPPLRGCDHARL